MSITQTMWTSLLFLTDDPLLQDNSVSPLYLACHDGSAECLSLLVEAGANLNLQNNVPATPPFPSHLSSLSRLFF